VIEKSACGWSMRVTSKPSRTNARSISTEKSFHDIPRAACRTSATRAELGSPRLRHNTITLTTMNGMPVKMPYSAYCRGINAQATIPMITAIAPLTHHSVRSNKPKIEFFFIFKFTRHLIVFFGWHHNVVRCWPRTLTDKFTGSADLQTSKFRRKLSRLQPLN
jgi:hypothetical protein